MTAKVVFYYLDKSEHNGKLRLTCNLANTAYKRGLKVYLHTVDDQACRVLDDMLWTFAANSFVPHTIATFNGEIDQERYPVVIGHVQPPEQFNDVLINLHHNVTEFVDQFERVIEPVDASADARAEAEEKINRYTELLGTQPAKHFV